MLRIWGRTNSINVQKVLWCCHELSLDYERIDAGSDFGVTDTPEYRAMNPNRLVPTIDDGDIRLWESNVIVRYLAQKHDYGRLCPADIATRFDAERRPQRPFIVGMRSTYTILICRTYCVGMI
jgi:glutathione S-transferase